LFVVGAARKQAKELLEIMQFNNALLAQIYRSAHQKSALIQTLQADGFRMTTKGKSK